MTSSYNVILCIGSSLEQKESLKDAIEVEIKAIEERMRKKMFKIPMKYEENFKKIREKLLKFWKKLVKGWENF